MNKKIFLTCLAAGILVFLLPAREVKAAENQTTEDYYYQLLIMVSILIIRRRMPEPAYLCRREDGSKWWRWQTSS